MSLNTLVSQLAATRRDRGLTQAELGARIGISQAAVAKLERATDEPSWMQVQRLAEGLGFELDTQLVPSQGRQVTLRLSSIARPVPELASPATGDRVSEDTCPANVVIGRKDGASTATALAGIPGVGKTVALASMVDSLIGRANLILLDGSGETITYLQKMRSKAMFEMRVSDGFFHGDGTGPTAEALALDRGAEGGWEQWLERAVDRLAARAAVGMPNVLLINESFRLTHSEGRPDDDGVIVNELLNRYPALDAAVFTTQQPSESAQQTVRFSRDFAGRLPVAFVGAPAPILVDLHIPEESQLLPMVRAAARHEDGSWMSVLPEPSMRNPGDQVTAALEDLDLPTYLLDAKDGSDTSLDSDLLDFAHWRDHQTGRVALVIHDPLRIYAEEELAVWKRDARSADFVLVILRP